MPQEIYPPIYKRCVNISLFLLKNLETNVLKTQLLQKWLKVSTRNLDVLKIARRSSELMRRIKVVKEKLDCLAVILHHHSTSQKKIQSIPLPVLPKRMVVHKFPR